MSKEKCKGGLLGALLKSRNGERSAVWYSMGRVGVRRRVWSFGY